MAKHHLPYTHRLRTRGYEVARTNQVRKWCKYCFDKPESTKPASNLHPFNARAWRCLDKNSALKHLATSTSLDTEDKLTQRFQIWVCDLKNSKPGPPQKDTFSRAHAQHFPSHLLKLTFAGILGRKKRITLTPNFSLTTTTTNTHITY